MNHAIRRNLSVCFLVAVVLSGLGVYPLFAQSIAEVTRAWDQRRAPIDTLRCVTVGDRTIAAGAYDDYIEDGVSSFPKGTKPPVPAKEYKSPYLYACLYDFRNHRARVETTFATFDSKTVSFRQTTLIRAFDGDVNRYIDDLKVTVSAQSGAPL